MDECDLPVLAKGLCVKHYKRLRRYGDPLIFKRIQKYPIGARCAVEGCDRKVKGRGFCRLHLDRQREYGDPGPAGNINSKREKRSLSPGRTVTPSGYISIWQPDRKKYAMEHRLIMEAELGRPLEAFESVHHINGVKDDNRMENLEIWTGLGAQPKGQRVADLVAFVVGHYPNEVRAALARQP